ncbi:MAG: hypothetical protein KF744_04430 [Taibaiella sp.]|nr:hypothetical protein [Taibaiella sp.]
MKLSTVFVFFAAMLLGSAAHSQVTITDADFPLVDGLVIGVSDTSSFIGVGTPGASQTWDFSAFIPTRLDTSTAAASTFTGNPLFPTATFSSCASAAGFSMCSFGYKNTSGMYMVGAEQNISVTGTSIHNMVFMLPYNQMFSFPFTYGHTRNYSYMQEQLAEYTPASPYDSVRTIYQRTVDQDYNGWGTLITPYGTYSAIRMQQIQSNIDTAYNHTPGGSWVMGATTSLSSDTSYTWFTPGIGIVAQISARMPHRYSFYKPAGTTGVNSDVQANFTAFPNPVQEKLYINSAADGADLWLIDITGRSLDHVQMKGKVCSIDMRPYEPGLYLLQGATVSGRPVRLTIAKQ